MFYMRVKEKQNHLKRKGTCFSCPSDRYGRNPIQTTPAEIFMHAAILIQNDN